MRRLRKASLAILPFVLALNPAVGRAESPSESFCLDPSRLFATQLVGDLSNESFGRGYASYVKVLPGGGYVATFAEREGMRSLAFFDKDGALVRKVPLGTDRNEMSDSQHFKHVDVLRDGTVAVHLGDTVKLVDKDGKIRATLKGDAQQPFMSALESGELAVQDSQGLRIVDSHGKTVREIPSGLRPFSAQRLSDGSISLEVARHGGKALLILDSRGHERARFAGLGPRILNLNAGAPQYTNIPDYLPNLVGGGFLGDGDFITLDAKANRLVLLDKDGNPKPLPAELQSERPGLVDILPDGRAVVHLENHLALLDAQGHVVRSYPSPSGILANVTPLKGGGFLIKSPTDLKKEPAGSPIESLFHGMQVTFVGADGTPGPTIPMPEAWGGSVIPVGDGSVLITEHEGHGNLPERTRLWAFDSHGRFKGRSDWMDGQLEDWNTIASLDGKLFSVPFTYEKSGPYHGKLKSLSTQVSLSSLPQPVCVEGPVRAVSDKAAPQPAPAPATAPTVHVPALSLAHGA